MHFVFLKLHTTQTYNTKLPETKSYTSIYQTPVVVLWSLPPTHMKSKGQCSQLIHTDLNDISWWQHTAILSWHCCASLHSQWSGKQDCLCLWLYQREDKNRYSLWIISHERRRDTLPVPTRNVGSLNSIRTKQPRRCLKIHPPRLHATCIGLQEQLNCWGG